MSWDKERTCRTLLPWRLTWMSPAPVFIPLSLNPESWAAGMAGQGQVKENIMVLSASISYGSRASAPWVTDPVSLLQVECKCSYIYLFKPFFFFLELWPGREPCKLPSGIYWDFPCGPVCHQFCLIFHGHLKEGRCFLFGTHTYNTVHVHAHILCTTHAYTILSLLIVSSEYIIVKQSLSAEKCNVFSQ